MSLVSKLTMRGKFKRHVTEPQFSAGVFFRGKKGVEDSAKESTRTCLSK